MFFINLATLVLINFLNKPYLSLAFSTWWKTWIQYFFWILLLLLNIIFFQIISFSRKNPEPEDWEAVLIKLLSSPYTKGYFSSCRLNLNAYWALGDENYYRTHRKLSPVHEGSLLQNPGWSRVDTMELLSVAKALP